MSARNSGAVRFSCRFASNWARLTACPPSVMYLSKHARSLGGSMMPRSRAQLGREQLVDRERVDLGRAREPSALDPEWHPHEAEFGEVLARVDLDLQPEAKRRDVLRLEPVEQIHAALFENASWRAEPWVEHTSNAVECVADGLSARLYEIDVFGVAGCRCEVELEERGSAAERQAIRKPVGAEDIHERPADDEILLDPRVLGPRCVAAPLRDVRCRDHRSGSTCTLIETFQRASPGNPAAVADGARATGNGLRA